MTKRGRILRPFVQALLDVKRVEGLHDDEKLSKDEPTPVQKVIDSFTKAKKGILEPQSTRDRRFGKAVSIVLAPYYGDPDKVTQRAEPFPNMSKEEARGIVAAVQEGILPDWVWAEQILPVWEGIVAAAEG